jgi:signal recognition particle subunit SRP54
MVRKKAIVQSMTPQERSRPEIISGPRRKRIARGCGQTVQDVNRFLTEFEQMRKMMRQMMGTQGKGKSLFGGRGKQPPPGPMDPPSGGTMGTRPIKGGPKMPKGGKSIRFPFGR